MNKIIVNNIELMKKIVFRIMLFIVFSAFFPLKSTSQISAKNGIYVSPRGTVRVLIVFAELVGGCGEAIVPDVNWPATGVPLNADLYLDYAVNSDPIAHLSQYYKDISLGELNLIGDYYDGTVKVVCDGTFNPMVYKDAERKAIEQLNIDWLPAGDGNYYTKHGLNLNDFDDFQTLPKGILKTQGISDGINGNIDCTVILWRNHPNMNCVGGLGVGNFFLFPYPQLKNKTVHLFGSWDLCPEVLTSGYDGFFTIEFMHAIFGENNFHVGGGAGDGTFMFDGTGAYTTNQGSTSNIVCGWDRNFLDWKGSRIYPISASDISGTEIQSDMSIDVIPI